MTVGPLHSVYELKTVAETYRPGSIAGSDQLDELLNRVAALIQGVLSADGSCAVLDVGCGAGGFHSLLANRLGHDMEKVDYTGIDSSAREIAMANETAGGNGGRFLRGDATALEFSDNRFDVVFESRMLEFLERPLLALERMVRVSRNKVFSMVTTHDEELPSLAPFFTPVTVDADGNVAENASLLETGANELFIDLLSPTDDEGKFYYAFCKHVRCLPSHAALAEFLTSHTIDVVTNDIHHFPQPNISSENRVSAPVEAGDKLEYLPVQIHLLTLDVKPK